MQRHPRVMSWVMGFLFCKVKNRKKQRNFLVLTLHPRHHAEAEVDTARIFFWSLFFWKLVTALMVSHITNDEYHPMGKTVW